IDLSVQIIIAVVRVLQNDHRVGDDFVVEGGGVAPDRLPVAGLDGGERVVGLSGLAGAGAADAANRVPQSAVAGKPDLTFDVRQRTGPAGVIEDHVVV